jgi:hypothetical protein
MRASPVAGALLVGTEVVGAVEDASGNGWFSWGVHVNSLLRVSRRRVAFPAALEASFLRVPDFQWVTHALSPEWRPQASGKINFPSGNLMFPGGEAMFPGGAMTFPGGEKVFPGGAMTFPGGEVMFLGGVMIYPGGEVMFPGGEKVFPGGKLASSAGKFIELWLTDNASLAK